MTRSYPYTGLSTRSRIGIILRASSLDHTMGAQAHMLSARVVVDIVGAGTDELGVDSGGEA